MNELWQSWKIETHADDIEIIIGRESKWPVVTLTEVATRKRFHIVPNDGELVVVEYAEAWVYSGLEYPQEWHLSIEYAHKLIGEHIPNDVTVEREVIGNG